MPWSLREARPTDLPALGALSAIVQDLHHQQHPRWLKPASADAVAPLLQARLDDDDAVVLLAEVAERAVGYCVAALRRRPDSPYAYACVVAELDELVVEAGSRRLGISRGLCDGVVTWATARGADRLELNTWEFNDAGRAAFSAAGFRPLMRKMWRPLAE